jgi:hypothetical protein
MTGTLLLLVVLLFLLLLAWYGASALPCAAHLQVHLSGLQAQQQCMH